MIDAHKMKYHKLYWEIAESAARQSVAKKAQVGACVVTSTGMIGIGWNGMPAGMENGCEYYHQRELHTKPEVIHAERNALDKLTKEGVSTLGSILFVTMAPCIECAKSLATVGIKAVYYQTEYKSDAGIQFLKNMGVMVHKCDNQ